MNKIIMSKRPGSAGATKATDDRDETEVKQIIRLVKKGDQRAFGDLVDRYRNQVAALAYKMVGDYDEAADITQNVFVKTSQNIWRYDESKRFYTWLYRITVNASIDFMRKHRRHRHEPLENVRETVENHRDNPERNFRSVRLREHINAAADKLNGKQRSAFILRDIEGCQIDDVANIMDMPEATVRWYLHRARQKIRKDLMRRCPSLLVAIGIK
ncbi:MAG: sigma-70 family RNA polymerase sigma factor [FCB group bacterium]|nr:sigma-70 family RNA polymerase sigma factor [FCB group bacterium]